MADAGQTESLQAPAGGLGARGRALLALFFILGLLVATSWFSYRNTASIEASNRLLRRHHEAREQLAALLAVVGDAEISIRSYLLTGHEGDLEPFRAARESVGRRLDEVDAVVARDADQSRRLAALREHIAERFRLLDEVSRQQSRNGPVTPIEQARAEAALRSTADLEEAIGEMLEAEGRSLQRQEEESKASLDHANRILAIGILIGLGVFLPVLYRLYREGQARERTQEALRSSERQLRLLIESVTDYAIFLVDADGRVRSWNRGAERLTGYRMDEIVGEPLARFYPEEELRTGGPARELEEAAEDGRHEGEGQRVRKDGSRFWANTVIAALRDDGHGLQGFSIAIRDVSERRRAAEALAASEKRYRAISELTSDYAYAFRIEPDGRVVNEWITDALTRITGYTPDELELLGGGMALVHLDDMNVALARLQRLVARQQDTSEFRIRTKRGEVRWIRESARPEWDEGERALRVFGAAQDITGQKQAEEKVRLHQAELAHVLRVGTINEMATGLAHEINQPLAAIVSFARGCSRRLRTKPEVSDEILSIIDEIAEQALRADQILRRLQSFVRKEEPRRERVQINDVVRAVARMVDGEATERGVQLRLDLAADLPPTMADSVQLEQVVLNVVRNGLEAVNGLRPERRQLSILTRLRDRETVEMAIRDLGDGIPAEKLEAIFRPFFTTKSQGLGMGLAISRSIIEAHGGNMWAASQPGQGTTFHVELPVHPESV